MGNATASLGPVYSVGHAFATQDSVWQNRRVSFDTKARRNESLLEAFRSLSLKQQRLGCHGLASGWVDRDPGQAFLLKNTSHTYPTRGIEHNTFPRLPPFSDCMGVFFISTDGCPCLPAMAPCPSPVYYGSRGTQLPLDLRENSSGAECPFPQVIPQGPLPS